VDEIREMGRATQGVTLISVGEGNKLSGLQRVVESDAEDSDGADSGEAGPGADAQPGDSAES
jgi:DNA gyrase subunit A